MQFWITLVLSFFVLLFFIKVIAYFSFDSLKNKRIIFLLGFELIIFFEILENFLLISGQIFQFPFLLRFPDPFHGLVGVLPFMYVRSFISEIEKKKTNTLIHWFWVPLSILFYWPVWQQNTIETLDTYYLGYVDHYTRLFASLQGAIAAVYCLASFLSLGHLKNLMENEYSNHPVFEYHWVRRYILILLVFFALCAITLLAKRDAMYPADYSLIYSVILLIVSLFSIISFMSTLGSKLEPVEVSSNDSIEKDPIEGKKSSLSQDELSVYLDKLDRYMSKHSVFLDPNLKISNLSNQTKIPQYILTQILNRIKNKSFYEYINELRVEHFKTEILKPENDTKTILSIALDSGFNSKSTFNENFKKVTGQTPMAYRRGIEKK